MDQLCNGWGIWDDSLYPPWWIILFWGRQCTVSERETEYMLQGEWGEGFRQPILLYALDSGRECGD